MSARKPGSFSLGAVMQRKYWYVSGLIEIELLNAASRYRPPLGARRRL
ncbi:MAG TPA: hypothetical protein VGQ52_04770 [Gemmatimonadaceae bacterium]|nr:hypothetical protein [Gemmatimonadaceae bacterium]